MFLDTETVKNQNTTELIGLISHQLFYAYQMSNKGYGYDNFMWIYSLEEILHWIFGFENVIESQATTFKEVVIHRHLREVKKNQKSKKTKKRNQLAVIIH